MTYRQYLRALDKVRAEARTKLGQFIGQDKAEKLVENNLEASIEALKVFDARAGSRLYSRVIELGRTSADWGTAAANELAAEVAEHLSYLIELSDAGKIKLALPRTFRVRIYGMNRRYEVRGGRAKYAPIKRKKKG